MNDEVASKLKNSGLATASLTLGILATVLGVVGIGVVLGMLAIVFGAVSIKDNRGKSLAGIITGAIGMVIFAVTLFVILIIMPNAVQNAQTSQEDTQRKSDVSLLATDVTTYMSNNRGQLPDNEWVSGMTYKLSVISSTASVGEPTTSSAIYVSGGDCKGNKSNRSYSITALLKNGTMYCQGS